MKSCLSEAFKPRKKASCLFKRFQNMTASIWQQIPQIIYQFLRLKEGGEGDNRGWDGWMASTTRWTWVWVSPRSWWWTGKPGMLHAVHGSQRVRHDWVAGLNWPQQRACSLEPGSYGYWARTLTTHALQHEKPPQWEVHSLQLKSSPHSPQGNKTKPMKRQRPSTQNKQINKNKTAM